MDLNVHFSLQCNFWFILFEVLKIHVVAEDNEFAILNNDPECSGRDAFNSFSSMSCVSPTSH